VTSSNLYRNTKNFLEDVPSRLPNSGPTPPPTFPCMTFAACQGAWPSGSTEASRGDQRAWRTTGARTSVTPGAGSSALRPRLLVGAVFQHSPRSRTGRRVCPGSEPLWTAQPGPAHLFKGSFNYAPMSRLTLGATWHQSGARGNARGLETGKRTFLKPTGGIARNQHGAT